MAETLGSSRSLTWRSENIDHLVIEEERNMCDIADAVLRVDTLDLGVTHTH